MVRICLNSYKMVFEKDTCDYFLYNKDTFDSQDERKFHEDKQVFFTELRSDRLKDKMITNNAWMKGMSHEGVQRMKDEYQRWKDGEILAPGQGQGQGEMDVRMMA